MACAKGSQQHVAVTEYFLSNTGLFRVTAAECASDPVDPGHAVTMLSATGEEVEMFRERG